MISIWLRRSLLLVFLAWIITPIVAMVYISLSSRGIYLLRSDFGLINYLTVLKSESFMESVGVSLRLATVVTLLSGLLSIPAAYSLSTYKTWSTRLLGQWIFSVRFIPPIVAGIPLFIILNRLNMVGSWTSLVIVNLTIGVPYSVWLLRAFAGDLPASLGELSHTDAISGLRKVVFVILPNLKKPVLLTLATVWLLIWNEFFFALLFGGVVRPVTVSLASWRTYQGVRWGELCAAGVLTAAPGVILFLALGIVFIRTMALRPET